MRHIVSAAIFVACFASAAAADNNDIFIDQIGNGNAVGSDTRPATQRGTNNLMDFNQSGNDGMIGVSAWPNQLQGAIQTGNSNTMEVSQPGSRNAAIRLEQRGDANDMVVKQSGHDNVLVLLNQQGDKHDASIVQRGNHNEGFARQVGYANDLTVLQSGNGNEFKVLSGDFGVNGRPGACVKCEVLLTQSGNGNIANVWQQDSRQLADITQSGSGNTVTTMQRAH